MLFIILSTDKKIKIAYEKQKDKCIWIKFLCNKKYNIKRYVVLDYHLILHFKP
jgi:hypothetical protein